MDGIEVEVRETGWERLEVKGFAGAGWGGGEAEGLRGKGAKAAVDPLLAGGLDLRVRSDMADRSRVSSTDGPNLGVRLGGSE
jgi:hypothetical protein